MSDDFGLKREVLILKSRVREVFTPHQPIQEISLFFGRAREVRKMIEHLGTPGQHALLYGERGVGKSSLANVATQILIKEILHGKLYVKRCDSQDTFATTVEDPLRAAGFDPSLTESSESTRTDGGAGVNLGVVSGQLGSETNRTATYKPGELSPSRVAVAISKLPGLLYIDEVDAIGGKQDRYLLAELMKQLSDAGSLFKVLLVGISRLPAT